MSFRIASFNIRIDHKQDKCNQWSFRKFFTKKIFNELNASIVCLQESTIHSANYLIKDSENFIAIGQSRDTNKNGEQCTILIDTKYWDVAKTYTRWFGDTPDSYCVLKGSTLPRIYTFVSLISKDGFEINIFNTHLDHKSESRRNESMEQLLLEINHDIPTIIAGDFNTDRNSTIFTNISNYSLSFASDSKGRGTFNGFGRFKETLNRNIDHILVSKHFDIIKSDVITRKPFNRYPSDHWPITADLKLKTKVDSNLRA